MLLGFLALFVSDLSSNTTAFAMDKGDEKTAQNGHASITRFIVTQREMPPLMRIPFILNGYRILHQPWSFYIKSSFSLHNETLNFWTHFIGGIVVLIEAIRFLQDFGSKWPMECAVLKFYTTCSMIMHFTSALTHLLHSRSCSVHLIAFMCDYCAISISALGICVSVFSFCPLPSYAQDLLPKILPLATLNAVVLTSVFCYFFVTRRRQYSTVVRVVMFLPTVVFYSWTFSIFIYQIYSKMIDPRSPFQVNHFGHMLVLGISFIFYSTRLPERARPGCFDICGNSHQIFHTLVSASQWLIIRSFRADVESNSSLLYSRQSQRLRTEYAWFYLIIVFLINATLCLSYHHWYKKPEDATLDINGKSIKKVQE